MAPARGPQCAAVASAMAVVGLLFGTLAPVAPVWATTARSAGMAGTVSAVTDGIEAARANPANLGTSSDRGVEVELVSGQMWLGNNSLDLDLYNSTTGQHLDEADKLRLLGSIPAGGWSSEFSAGASALGLRAGRWAFTFTGSANGYTTLPYDVFELVLMGNAIADSIDFENAAGEAFTVAAARVSGAMTPLRHPWGGIHLGAGVAYLYGMGYARIDQVQGNLVSSSNQVAGEAYAQLTTATRGAGVGLDVGVATEFGPRWRASLALHNAVARIRFDRDVELRTYVAAIDTLGFARIEEIEGPNDLSDPEGSVAEAEPFEVDLPRSLHFGIARVGTRFRCGVEYVRGFEDRAGTTKRPRAAVGLEWKLLGWLPLRTGVGAGGRTERWASAGFGLELSGLHLDFAATSLGEWWPGSPKGIALAAGVGLHF